MYLSEASLACVTNAILIIVLTELHYTVYSLSWSFLTFSFLCCTFLFLQSTTTCTLFFSSFFAYKAIPNLSCAHHQTQIHAYFLHSEASSFFSLCYFYHSQHPTLIISSSETWDSPSPMLCCPMLNLIHHTHLFPVQKFPLGCADPFLASHSHSCPVPKLPHFCTVPFPNSSSQVVTFPASSWSSHSNFSSHLKIHFCKLQVPY